MLCGGVANADTIIFEADVDFTLTSLNFGNLYLLDSNSGNISSLNQDLIHVSAVQNPSLEPWVATGQVVSGTITFSVDELTEGTTVNGDLNCVTDTGTDICNYGGDIVYGSSPQGLNVQASYLGGANAVLSGNLTGGTITTNNDGDSGVILPFQPLGPNGPTLEGYFTYLKASYDYTITDLRVFDGAPVSAVPIPASGLMLLGALASAAAWRRRKQSQRHSPTPPLLAQATAAGHHH